MKMKLGEANVILNALTEMEDLNLPIRLSYAISYNTEQLGKIVARLEKERVKICEKMAAQDVDGKPILEDGKYQFATPDDEKAAIAEYSELLEETEDVEIRKVPMSELYKCEEDKRLSALSARNVKALSFMVEDE